MKLHIYAAAFLFLFGGYASAESSSSESSQFQLDKDLVNTLYNETVTEAKTEQKRGPSRLKIQTELTYLMPTQLTLSNQYFDVQYGDVFSGLPGLNLALSQSILTWKGVSVSLLGKVGFARKEALTVVRTKSGEPFRDMIQLSRVPLTAGFRTDFAFSDNAKIRPYLETSAGIQWLYQSGKLDKALEQGFWIPFYQVGFGTNLFGGGSSEDWFGGVDLGASLQRSFASSQISDSWAINVGVTLYL